LHKVFELFCVAVFVLFSRLSQQRYLFTTIVVAVATLVLASQSAFIRSLSPRTSPKRSTYFLVTVKPQVDQYLLILAVNTG